MTRTQLITLLRSTAASQETLHHVMHVWRDEKQKYMQMDRLFEICCMCVGITPEQGKEKTRDRPRVRARQLFCYTGRDWYTLKDMGEFLGGRDHTTALHARDTAIDLLETDDALFLFDMENVRLGIAGMDMNPLPVREKATIDRKVTLIHDVELDLYYRTVKSITQNFGYDHRTGLNKIRARYGDWRFKYRTFKQSETKGLDIVL